MRMRVVTGFWPDSGLILANLLPAFVNICKQLSTWTVHGPAVDCMDSLSTFGNRHKKSHPKVAWGSNRKTYTLFPITGLFD